jgi:hypothetical protein
MPAPYIGSGGLEYNPQKFKSKGENLDTQEIVKELKAERYRLNRAIAALDGANNNPTTATNEPSRKGVQGKRLSKSQASSQLVVAIATLLRNEVYFPEMV